MAKVTKTTKQVKLGTKRNPFWADVVRPGRFEGAWVKLQGEEIFVPDAEILDTK